MVGIYIYSNSLYTYSCNYCMYTNNTYSRLALTLLLAALTSAPLSSSTLTTSTEAPY